MKLLVFIVMGISLVDKGIIVNDKFELVLFE